HEERDGVREFVADALDEVQAGGGDPGEEPPFLGLYCCHRIFRRWNELWPYTRARTRVRGSGRSPAFQGGACALSYACARGGVFHAGRSFGGKTVEKVGRSRRESKERRWPRAGGGGAGGRRAV